MKNYIKLILDLPEEDFEKAFFVLYDYDFCGIEERFDQLAITFEEKIWSEELKNKILLQLEELGTNIVKIEEENIAEINWNEEWEKKLQPFEVNERIGITPSSKINTLKKEIELIINPKMSFGTGEHATTRLSSNLMDGVVQPNSFWIDAGTGTGVLAILAIKLGANRCYAFDNNDWSVENAIENAGLNQVLNHIDIENADIDVIELPEANGIVANLFIHLIKSSMQKFYNALLKKKGDLIISGIMSHDALTAETSAIDCGFSLVRKIEESEWCAFHFKIK